MKVTQCIGNGQGECKRCSDNGKWNRVWTSMLYKIEGLEGCYCGKCVNDIKQEKSRKLKYADENTLEYADMPSV